MKTSILSIVTVLFSVIVLSSSVKAATINTNNDNQMTVLADVSNFNKIEVHGNVELYISDGATNSVKVYNNYYAENALVQNQKGVLRISSYKAEKLVLWVTVADLRSLSVYDNAVVKSFKSLSAISLDVNLYNNATAQLNFDASVANITLNDHAKADLSGNVGECYMAYNQSATVNSTNFVTEHITKNVSFTKVVEKTEEAEITTI